MKMIDVGEEPQEVMTETPDRKEKYYPCLNLRDVNIEGLDKVGEDVTLIVNAHIKGIREDGGVDLEIREVGMPDKKTMDGMKNKADEDLEKMSGSNSRY
jgi:hypothetical protein